MLEEKLQALPSGPGVYLMKNAEGKIIYVGKAISLKNRVKSYFQTSRHDSAKTRALVKNIRDLDYILTDSELEALILENNLIKKYRPKYNINLKDDKTYPYIKITKEAYPRVVVTRKRHKDGAKYFGPFTSATNLRETLELLQKIFPYRTCRQKKFTNERPCLNAHIKRCLAPCVGKITQDEYNEIIHGVVLFLEGKQEHLVVDLEKKMSEAAQKLEFEKAAQLRDQIKKLKGVMARQKIVLQEDIDQDVVAMARGLTETCVQLFFIRGGKVMGRDTVFLKGTEESSREEILESFLKQYYNQQEFIPKEILLEKEVPDQEILEEWLSQKRGNRVYIKTPQRGEKKDLVELVGKNALEVVQRRELEIQQKRALTEGAVYELQEVLDLEEPPHRIECYDISNIQGRESVGSMIVFQDGQPQKDQYRRFKIKTVVGPDDFASIYEIISRRFNNVHKKNDRFSVLPQLIIIDGGKGQLNMARKAMAEQGFSHIPTFSLAEKEELLFTENRAEPIVLPSDSKALFLVQRVRDEAHRFAITYHRSLRGKRNLASILEDIPGVGEKRRKNLLKHFGSLKRIQEASVEELLEVEGINSKVAESIYHYLNTHKDLLLRLKKK